MSALLASAALPRAARALPTNPDVVVVGAGAAGIAAARALIARGVEVVVVEAADRMGGRAHSESESLGLPFDRGCSWLQGPEDLPHIALARDLGFGLHDSSNARDVLFVGDRRADAAERRANDRAWGAVEAALEGARGDVAAASVLPRDMPFAKTVATWIGPMDFGVDFHDLSTADWNSYEDYDHDYLVHEGLGRLAVALGDGLPVQLSTAVTGIDYGGEGVAVETTRGTIRAKAVIVTVSTGVLASGAIRFSPALPDWKQEAIGNVPMSLLTKIGLRFDGARFGLRPGEFLTRKVEGDLPAEACFFLTFPTGHDYVVGFVGGDFARALAPQGEAAAIDFALSELAGMVGTEVHDHFLQGTLTRWDSDPLTLGAYSAARPGHFTARAELARPLAERVFFAGEAVGTPYAALLSGAHLSGEEVAGLVADLLTGAESCSSCDARKEGLGPLTQDD